MGKNFFQKNKTKKHEKNYTQKKNLMILCMRQTYISNQHYLPFVRCSTYIKTNKTQAQIKKL